MNNKPYFVALTCLAACAVQAQFSIEIFDTEMSYPADADMRYGSATSVGVSADGNKVAGTRTTWWTTPSNSVESEAYLMTYSGGSWTIQMLGDLPDNSPGSKKSSRAVGISAAGMPAGHGTGDTPQGYSSWPVTFNPIQMLTKEPDIYMYPTMTGISGNGSVIVGFGQGSYTTNPNDGQQRFWHRWVNGAISRIVATGSGSPAGLSYDGNVFTGYTLNPADGNRWNAVRWTPSGGIGLVPKPLNVKHMFGNVVSGNGVVIAGKAQLPDEVFNDYRPFYWSPSGGTKIFDGPGGYNRGEVFAISNDGTVLGGIAVDGSGTGTGFIWTPWSGVVDLQVFLAENGVNMTNIDLIKITGMSSDGTTVTGDASVPNTVNGNSTTRPFVARIALPNGLESIYLNRTSTTGGNTVNGSIGTHFNATSPLTVNLSSDNPAAIVPPSITVPVGQASALFNVTTNGVSQSTPVVITANYNGILKTRNLVLIPAQLYGVAVNPKEVFGTSGLTGIIGMTGKAPAGGLEVALSDNTTAIATPASATVPEGSTGVNFPITTSNVAADVTRQVMATYSGVTKTVSLKIKAYHATQSLVLTPNPIKGGQAGTGTVTITLPAPAGGVTVNLSSNSSVIIVPSSVSIPAGAKTATFAFTTKPVAAAVTRAVTATYGMAGKTFSLTLNP